MCVCVGYLTAEVRFHLIMEVSGKFTLCFQATASTKRLAKQVASLKILTQLFPEAKFYYQIAGHESRKRLLPEANDDDGRARKVRDTKIIGQWSGSFAPRTTTLSNVILRPGACEDDPLSDFNKSNPTLVKRLKVRVVGLRRVLV